MTHRHATSAFIYAYVLRPPFEPQSVQSLAKSTKRARVFPEKSGAYHSESTSETTAPAYWPFSRISH